VQGYRGRFVVPTAAVTTGGVTFTPTQAADGVLDERVAFTAVVYPQPFGIEAEWTVGRGRSSRRTFTIGGETLQGGYVQISRLKIRLAPGSRSPGGITRRQPQVRAQRAARK
jgi:hypothetical protein